jgi:hypothetical protein
MRNTFAAARSAGPVSPKVLAGLITGMAGWLLNFIATTYVWPHGMPPPAKQMIGGVAAAIGFALGGYLARHRVTAKELEEAVRYAESVRAALGAAEPVSMSISASVAGQGGAVVPAGGQCS